ncbi:DUF4232 domain-containing protein [Streptomyces sp. NPDC050560]|uniref:DUF4232 domain-containing protein n=1 Tax=Streptomyces sp. NPDC050560 TaxID=3365630 RepID=UPI0037AABB1F
MRVRKLTFATLAIVASLSLGACGGGDDDGGGDDAASSGSGAPSESTAPSPSGSSESGGSDQGDGKDSTGGDSAGKGAGGADSDGGSGGTDSGGTASGGTGSGGADADGAGSDGDGGVGKCRTDGLDFTAKDDTIDGDPEAVVVVTMTNKSGHDCTMRGFAGVDLKTNAGAVSAKRTGQPAHEVTLEDGKPISFFLECPFSKKGGAGVRISKLVVTPPGEAKSVTLDWPGQGSLPVAGDGATMKLGPIGSAGQGG